MTTEEKAAYEEKNERNIRVKAYIDARIHSDRLAREVTVAQEKAGLARDAMQEAWRECLRHDVRQHKGVYSFKEHYRTAIVVGDGDYPDLTYIVA